jgi:hypothetical protein
MSPEKWNRHVHPAHLRFGVDLDISHEPDFSCSMNLHTSMEPNMEQMVAALQEYILNLVVRPHRKRPQTPSPPPESMLDYRPGFIRLKRDADDDDDDSRNFGRQANPTRSSPNQQPSRTNTSSPSASSPSALYPPNTQQAQPPPSPGGAPVSMNPPEQMQQPVQNGQNGRKLPTFFREDYIGFIVKGNFMTLAAKPALVEEGEWLSHQGNIAFRGCKTYAIN